MKWIKVNLSGLIVLAACLFMARPLLTPGFLPTHDGEYHLIRFFEFDKNIRAKIFFPRWAPGLDSGYGVPLFNYFYPLPNYVGEVFYLSGFSFIDSFKLTLASGLILSGLFFYLWAKQVWGKWGGVAGAVFYLTAPYHLLDVYVRGAVGEVWALVWFPAILWAIEKSAGERKEKFFLFASLFTAFLTLSHNILALIFVPFLLSYILFSFFVLPGKNRLKTTGFRLLAVLTGFGLSAYFWLPALVEAQSVVGLRLVNLADHFPAFSQLIIPSWGTGFSVAGEADQMSFQVGIPHLLTAFLALVFAPGIFRKDKTGRKKSALVFFILIWIGLVFCLLSPSSLVIWEFVPLMNLFQYPWRLLSLAILLTSFSAGFLASVKKSRCFRLGLIFLLVVFYGWYFKPVKYLPRFDDLYLNNPDWSGGTATTGNSFKTAWAREGTGLPGGGKFFTQEECEIKTLLENPVKRRFEINCQVETQTRYGVNFFPGWRVLVDQREWPVIEAGGLVGFQLPAGSHQVEIVFQNTPVRRLASQISRLCLLFLTGLVILESGRSSQKKNESRH